MVKEPPKYCMNCVYNKRSVFVHHTRYCSKGMYSLTLPNDQFLEKGLRKCKILGWKRVKD